MVGEMERDKSHLLLSKMSSKAAQASTLHRIVQVDIAVSALLMVRWCIQEVTSLSSALPLEFASSVFVRSDEERLDLMRAVIAGPASTPYAPTADTAAVSYSVSDTIQASFASTSCSLMSFQRAHQR